MTATPTNLELVSFDDPPVQEIAFAFQLPDAQLTVEEIVDIGRALRPSFPVQQLQPALPRMLGPTESPLFSFPVGPSLPRFWFVSTDGLRLVQVQEDRVAFNWRRLGREVVYPRYGTLRAEFEEHVERLTETIPSLKDLHADLCELTYVNELVDEQTADRVPLDQVLRTVRPIEDAEFLPGTDQAEWQGRWTIRDEGGDVTGWLTAAAQPASRQRDDRPIYLLTMTGILPGEVHSRQMVFDRFDLAHEWIVRGFADLTTKEMHDRWGRTR